MDNHKRPAGPWSELWDFIEERALNDALFSHIHHIASRYGQDVALCELVKNLTRERDEYRRIAVDLEKLRPISVQVVKEFPK